MTADELRSAEASYREAFRLSEEKRAIRNALLLEAQEAGWSIRQIASALEISPTRVAQILGTRRDALDN